MTRRIMRSRALFAVLVIGFFISGSGCPAEACDLTESCEIGKSVEGKPIVVTRVGSGRKLAICLIAGIHGDEKTTSVLVDTIRNEYKADPGLVPKDARLYFLPYSNPDGYAKETRSNARKVDLNRNFPTKNWKKDAVSPSSVRKGSGGASPGSEPETASIVAWLTDTVKREADRVIVISYHSLYPPTGAVQAGYVEYGKPEKESTRIAAFISKETGYKHLDTWVTGEDLTGELLGWCIPMNILVVDIELPDRDPPDKVKTGARLSHIDLHRSLLPKLFDM
jgi:predicted deacylase